MAQLDAVFQRHGVHPAHVVVLVPYAQLLPIARGYWARRHPDGFAPRFETTTSWSTALGAAPPSGLDVTGDIAHDALTAQTLLERAGLADQAAVLAPAVVEAAQQLHRVVCAHAPDRREAWGQKAREAVAFDAGAAVLAYEAAAQRIALEWALASGCHSDLLFSPAARAGGVRCLVVLEGLREEPLAEALAQHWATVEGVCPVERIRLNPDAMPAAAARLHACADAEDEAERAAACVLARVAEGAVPVALVAIDRALTRRIGALLSSRGLVLRDESGWKLSTTRAAADVMAALRACSRQASADDVLDWLKSAPALRGGLLRQLEAALRRDGVRLWRSWRPPRTEGLDALREFAERIDGLRATMQSSRPLAAWIGALRGLLQAGGRWESLTTDAAGGKLVATLRLDDGAAERFTAELAEGMWAERGMGLSDFTAWVNRGLEAVSFLPEARWQTVAAQVLVLPLTSLLARPVGAVVLPGCDEVRLPAAPEPPGEWTAAQRAALGLPTREILQTETAQAWKQALLAPSVDLLWRAGDAGGEPLLASPLVLALRSRAGAAVPGDDPRERRSVALAPTVPPLPRGDALPVARLSASAYEDLRKCPYRFFALRQLGLQEADELDAEVDKRDFGIWLHAVLRSFHEGLAADPCDDAHERRARLDAAADEATRRQGLAPEEFLPFAASWPQVRDGYLAWLAGHEAAGLRFDRAESWHDQPLGPVALVGQIDRLDKRAEGLLVIDYKTESLATSRDRVKNPSEDTQLAFYAALVPDDTLRAAYVNVGERGETQFVEQPDVVAARDALVEGILSDLGRIAEGQAMPALGEGAVCDWCAARGLCRKDFWM
nr:PD-(D/E)XK nuclease family protein [Xylophilus sp.]